MCKITSFFLLDHALILHCVAMMSYSGTRQKELLCVCVCVCVYKKLFSFFFFFFIDHALILQCVATMSYSSTWQKELPSFF